MLMKISERSWLYILKCIINYLFHIMQYIELRMICLENLETLHTWFFSNLRLVDFNNRSARIFQQYRVIKFACLRSGRIHEKLSSRTVLTTRLEILPDTYTRWFHYIIPCERFENARVLARRSSQWKRDWSCARKVKLIPWKRRARCAAVRIQR